MSASDQPTPFYETEDDKFAGPTSCIVGQGLGFGATDLLVTEGGIVTIDPTSYFGNRLSVVRFDPIHFSTKSPDLLHRFSTINW